MLCAAVLLSIACLGLTARALTVPDTAPEGPEDDERVRLPIVMYHHISDTKSIWGKYVVSAEEFERDLRWLREHGYETVRVQDLIAWSEGRFTLPEKPCIITLDDGYESTGVCAAPLLEKYGFTGVVAVIGAVAQQYSDQPDHNLRYSHMSWEAVAELSHRGVLEVQCHTWDMHTLSPRQGCNRMKGEAESSYRTALEKDLGQFADACAAYGVKTVPSVAYPFGAYCALTREIVAANGFRAAFTCTERVNLLTGAPEELLELGRFNRPHGVSSAEFFGKWEEKG